MRRERRIGVPSKVKDCVRLAGVGCVLSESFFCGPTCSRESKVLPWGLFMSGGASRTPRPVRLVSGFAIASIDRRQRRVVTSSHHRRSDEDTPPNVQRHAIFQARQTEGYLRLSYDNEITLARRFQARVCRKRTSSGSRPGEATFPVTSTRRAWASWPKRRSTVAGGIPRRFAVSGIPHPGLADRNRK